MPSQTPSKINKVVRAGAGAGKTTALVSQVLGFQQEFQKTHGRMAKVAVTTFTRKATEELRERLLTKALQSNERNLIDFVQKSSQLHISTIHGVLALLLQRHGSAMGLPAKLEFISGRQQHLQLKKIFRNLIQNDQAVAANVNTLLEYFELSKVLAALKAYAENSIFGYRPVTIEELKTQQQEKKMQLQIQIAAYLTDSTDDLPEPWLEFARILTSLQNKLEPRSLALFLDDFTFPRKSKKIPESLNEQKAELKKALEDFVEYYLSDEFIEQHQELSLAFADVGSKFSARVWQEKISTGQISMSDLEPLALQFIQDHPELIRNFSEDWDYWLVDEFQDTSPTQVKILNSLVGQENYYTVGDPQQSIYLFRGSRTEVFEARELVATEKILQMKNYRSSPAVLNFVNEVFSNLPSGQFQKMEIGYDLQKKSYRPIESEAIHLLFAIEDSEIGAEIEATVFRIQELLKIGVPAEEICVLARTNKDLESISDQAEQLKIPVKLHSSAQFSERQEIIDASSLLRVMINPQDNLSLLQCLRSPYHRVSEKELQKIASKRVSGTLWSAAIKLGIEQVLSIQSATQRALEIGIVNAWRETLLDRKYFEILHGLDPSGQKEANLWKLINLMQTAERRSGFNPLGVLDDFFQGSLERGDGEGDATPVVEPQKVNLMTIHASKGLEFDYLIVPFLGKRLQRQSASLWMSSEEDRIWTLTIPDPQTGKMTSSIVADQIMRIRADREFQEIERLYYVAFTRAKLGLSLILSKQEEGSFAFRLWQSAVIQKPIELEDFSREIDEIQSAGTATIRLRRKDWTSFLSDCDQDKKSAEVRPQMYTPKSMMKAISVTSLVSPKVEFRKQSGMQQVATESSVQRFEVSQRGVHAHKVFENLKYLNVQAELPGVDFLRSWESGKIMKLIKAGEVEWGFTVKDSSFYLQGQIDLWGVTAEFPDGAVVDYKTGNEANLEVAFAQLEVYAWVLRKMGKLPAQGIPELLVVYPFTKSVKIRKAMATTNSTEYVRRLMEPLLST